MIEIHSNLEVAIHTSSFVKRNWHVIQSLLLEELNVIGSDAVVSQSELSLSHCLFGIVEAAPRHFIHTTDTNTTAIHRERGHRFIHHQTVCLSEVVHCVSPCCCLLSTRVVDGSRVMEDVEDRWIRTSRSTGFLSNVCHFRSDCSLCRRSLRIDVPSYSILSISSVEGFRCLVILHRCIEHLPCSGRIGLACYVARCIRMLEADRAVRLDALDLICCIKFRTIEELPVRTSELLLRVGQLSARRVLIPHNLPIGRMNGLTSSSSSLRSGSSFSGRISSSGSSTSRLSSLYAFLSHTADTDSIEQRSHVIDELGGVAIPTFLKHLIEVLELVVLVVVPEDQARVVRDCVLHSLSELNSLLRRKGFKLLSDVPRSRTRLSEVLNHVPQATLLACRISDGVANLHLLNRIREGQHTSKEVHGCACQVSILKACNVTIHHALNASTSVIHFPHCIGRADTSILRVMRLTIRRSSKQVGLQVDALITEDVRLIQALHESLFLFRSAGRISKSCQYAREVGLSNALIDVAGNGLIRRILTCIVLTKHGLVVVDRISRITRQHRSLRSSIPDRSKRSR
ncbi:hypothetical protein WT58_23950 [Burkholderia territorii]|nr:hypothetical protein WT58_23950 [Burkholderia territorii]